MKATEQLKHDHRVIERMLSVLEEAANRVERADFPPDFFPKAVDLIRNFADKCHHGKEEELLFPALEDHGIPKQAGPIGVMLAEHEQGRAYVRGLAEAVTRLARKDKTAYDAIKENSRGYAGLLRSHIDKEDNVLFAMADKVLSDREQEHLNEAFEEIEEKRLGSGKHEAYVKTIEGWERKFGIATPSLKH